MSVRYILPCVLPILVRLYTFSLSTKYLKVLLQPFSTFYFLTVSLRSVLKLIFHSDHSSIAWMLPNALGLACLSLYWALVSCLGQLTACPHWSLLPPKKWDLFHHCCIHSIKFENTQSFSNCLILSKLTTKATIVLTDSSIPDSVTHWSSHMLNYGENKCKTHLLPGDIHMLIIIIMWCNNNKYSYIQNSNNCSTETFVFPYEGTWQTMPMKRTEII